MFIQGKYEKKPKQTSEKHSAASVVIPWSQRSDIDLQKERMSVYLLEIGVVPRVFTESRTFICD